MVPLTISEIMHAVNGVLLKQSAEQSVTSVSTDTRTLAKGSAFFALSGERFDGHAYLTQAVEKGALACVISKLPDSFDLKTSGGTAFIQVKEPKQALRDLAKYYRAKVGNQTQIVSINGSNGKTTVKEMLAQILQKAGSTVYTIGNLNNEIGCPLSLFNLHPEHQYGVFEIGSSARGEVRYLAEMVNPQIAVITNIGLEHTETFGTIQDIAEGESELLPGLPKNGCAILPYDNLFYKFLADKVPEHCRIKSFGFSNKASVYVRQMASDGQTVRQSDSQSFVLVHQSGQGQILNQFKCTLPVMGKFNVLNACAAAAAALALQVPEDKIIEGLKNFSQPEMRFQVFQLKTGTVIVNDAYNANPASMRSAIEGFMESFPNRKKCLVLGDMLELGKISRQEHESLGKWIASLPEICLFAYGPESQWLVQTAKKYGVHFKDKQDLLKEVQFLLMDDTAILFKGSRGMHLEEIVDNIKAW